MGLFATPDERALVAELVAQLRYATEHLSQTSERLAVGVMNHVLDVQTRTFDATGLLALNWQATCGCIKVVNLGTADITVTSSTPGTMPTNGGFGVTVVPAGAWDVVNVNSRFVTLYGTSGQRVSFQAFTFGGLAAGGFVSIDGGAP